MRILVAGASGAVGRRLIPRLVRAGHTVVGLTRTPEKAAFVQNLGAEAAVADALDAASVVAAIMSARPDVIVHELTDLQGAADLRKFDRSFASSNRLRRQGTDNRLRAARGAGVRRFIAQSFCGWPYARIGGPIKSEEDPLDPQPPRELRPSLDAIKYLERAVTSGADVEGIVLRYGAFYGSDTGVFDGGLVEQLRKRRVPLIGSGNGYWSFLHIEDAAAATAIAAERGNPGIYNIVDDDPAPVREWLPALAGMLGAKAPFRVPEWLARMMAGEHVVAVMTQCRAGSNAKARRELGWRPTQPSWRRGFAEAIGQLEHARRAA